MWASTRDVLRVDAETSGLESDWGVEEGRRTQSRLVRLRGEIAPGSTVGIDGRPFALYAMPTPFHAQASARVIHVPHEVEVVEVLDDGYIVRETTVQGQTWDELPIALTPASPPRAASQQGAIEEWAQSVHRAAPDFPHDAATDILRRIPPRTISGEGLPDAGDDMIEAIVRGVRDLHSSYLAVQGPPGTGKTYTGSQVIARLVRDHGFRVGVVAQSHAIVENLLERVVADGVPASRVGKAPKSGDTREKPYTILRKDGMAAFLDEHARDGVVVGGTAWDFSNTRRVDRGALDLLVIDEV